MSINRSCFCKFQLVMWIALRHNGYDSSTGSNRFHNNTSTVTVTETTVDTDSVAGSSIDKTNTDSIRRRHDRYVDSAWGLDLTPRMYLNNGFALLNLVSIILFFTVSHCDNSVPISRTETVASIGRYRRLDSACC